MIEKITFNCGPAPDSEPLELDLKPSVTIFVGPNNSGKSAALHALRGLIINDKTNKKSAIKNLDLMAPSNNEINAYFKKVTKIENRERTLNARPIDYESFKNDFLSNIRKKPTPRMHRHFLESFFRPLVLHLTGRQRLSEILPKRDQSTSNPTTKLGKLFIQDEKYLNFKKTVFNAIGLYPIADRLTKSDEIGIKYTKTLPDTPLETVMQQKGTDFIKSCIPHTDVSDGCQAITGIYLALTSQDYKCCLIDEPEAFSHPPLAQKLGKHFGKSALEGKQIFAANHSANFVMGAIESGAEVNIIRLDYQDSIATANKILPQELKRLKNNPLLRSANIISGLFSKFVIVCEGDSDRAFYQEINHRLAEAEDTRGLDDLIFLHGNNKQSMPTIISLLRKMGIPAAGIVDLDIIKKGNEWGQQIKFINFPDKAKTANNSTREQLLKACTHQEGDTEKFLGLNELSDEDKQVGELLLNPLKEYGLFVVKNGDPETWLDGKFNTGKKKTWLLKVFEHMGEDPNDDAYIKPTAGDVWDFIGDVNKWLANPNRKGMRPPA